MGHRVVSLGGMRPPGGMEGGDGIKEEVVEREEEEDGDGGDEIIHPLTLYNIF